MRMNSEETRVRKGEGLDNFKLSRLEARKRALRVRDRERIQR